MMMPDIVYAINWLCLQDEMRISEMQKFLSISEMHISL